MNTFLYPGCLVTRQPWRVHTHLYAEVHETEYGGISKSGGFTSHAVTWIIVAVVTMSFEEFWLVMSNSGEVGWTAKQGWNLLNAPDRNNAVTVE